MRLDYFNFEGFENIYLEDSYVLEIKTNSTSVEILLEAVLTEQHSLYTNPRENEHYCCKKIVIHFPDVEGVIWIDRKMIPNTDANGEIDFGNIDEFYLENDFYRLSGEWGELKIKSAKPTIEYIEN